MEFFLRIPKSPTHLAIFPGTFNPPTIAHLSLAHAALSRADQVLFVLPRTFPHKLWHGPSFEQRLDLLRQALPSDLPFSLAATGDGLFIDIAHACRRAYGPYPRLSFLCGRDAAERILNWDYGRPGAAAEMLDEFDLLVASRQGSYAPPAHFQHRIHALACPAFDEVSATRVRETLAAGGEWRHLVPPGIQEKVEALYSTGP